MGRVKEALLRESEDIVREIEDLIQEVEDDIASHGEFSPDVLDRMTTAFSAYRKVWPADDMAHFSQSLMAAIEDGEVRYAERQSES